MGENFDEFSKHLATKHSRRGAFKVVGAGIVGAAMSTLFARNASAGKPRVTFNSTLPRFNQNILPNFNQTIPNFNGNQQVTDYQNTLNQILQNLLNNLPK